MTIQNGYAAANITVEAGQQLSSTGWYGFVRHPMYFGNVILMIGTPLALGSSGAAVVIVGLAVSPSHHRRGDSAQQQLAGYREYMDKVHYRLVPYVW